jgi:Cu(I)/Ag(I) efflux system membrane fusion protein
MGEGQYKSVEVNLGQVTSEFAQILAGVEFGDQVVTSAQFLLDSESSIHSDFMRMAPNKQEHDHD